MNRYWYTAVWGLAVWLLATIFFRLFGEYVLFHPDTSAFLISTSLLSLGTGGVLFAATRTYMRSDQSDHAALRFGVIGTGIGLLLDTFSLANHSVIFPKLDDAQVIAFTVWITFAYALYLFIPAMMNQKRNRKEKS
ncbi:DUF5367 family protein [Brevibacillus ginsengisoli]|uniref:DUF5367 family protein n=1 Tax=Brevibacillus ginsengisoli TaxID=363854 RepID=UPI003CEB9A21